MLDLHKDKRQQLKKMIQDGVQSILLLGDKGIGKKTIVARVVGEFDNILFTNYPEFGINDAREIKNQALRKSMFLRVFLIDGDNATVQAYNALLKTLEEPLPNIAIIITSSKPPLSTITSRCRVINISPFTMQELMEVLQYNGMSQRAASSVVPFAHGSYTRALRVYEVHEEKIRLISYLQAIYKRDTSQVFKLASTISEYEVGLLKELCEDLVMSRYGLADKDMSSLFKGTPTFLVGVKDALSAGRSPALNFLRAYFSIL